MCYVYVLFSCCCSVVVSALLRLFTNTKTERMDVMTHITVWYSTRESLDCLCVLKQRLTFLGNWRPEDWHSQTAWHIRNSKRKSSLYMCVHVSSAKCIFSIISGICVWILPLFVHLYPLKIALHMSRQTTWECDMFTFVCFEVCVLKFVRVCRDKDWLRVKVSGWWMRCCSWWSNRYEETAIVFVSALEWTA